MTNEMLSKVVSAAVDEAFADNSALISRELGRCLKQGENLELAIASALPRAMSLTAHITMMMIIRILEHQGVIQLPADGDPILHPLF